MSPKGIGFCSDMELAKTLRTTLIIIPAHNEGACIQRVVAEIQQTLRETDILVISDGSTDSTLQEAESAGAMTLNLCCNLGIGGAVQAGYRFAVEMKYNYVMRLDGDGQHDPARIPSMLAPICAGQADMVLGSRYLTGRGYAASTWRRIGSRLFSALVLLMTGQRFTDTTSGFSAANRPAFSYLAQHLPTDYPEIESLVLMCRAKFRLEEVPVTMRPRMAGQSSISTLRAVYYVCKVLLAVLIGSLRVPRSRSIPSRVIGKPGR